MRCWPGKPSASQPPELSRSEPAVGFEAASPSPADSANTNPPANTESSTTVPAATALRDQSSESRATDGLGAAAAERRHHAVHASSEHPPAEHPAKHASRHFSPAAVPFERRLRTHALPDAEPTGADSVLERKQRQQWQRRRFQQFAEKVKQSIGCNMEICVRLCASVRDLETRIIIIQ